MKKLACLCVALLLAASTVQSAYSQAPTPPPPPPVTIPPDQPAPPPVGVPVDINNPTPPPPITTPVTPVVTPPVGMGDPLPPSSNGPASAPEPASIVSALLGAGFASLAAWRLRKTRARRSEPEACRATRTRRRCIHRRRVLVHREERAIARRYCGSLRNL